MGEASVDFMVDEQVLEEALRHQARNILDSYANPWDVLAEGLQNAVDAVEERAGTDPDQPNRIHITFDARQRAIRITDTGNGIPAEYMTRVLAPHISHKRGERRTRGEKGVGLSFLVFCCNSFQVASSHGGTRYGGTVRRANAWARGEEDARPTFEPGDVADEGPALGSDTWTTVTIGDLPEVEQGEPDVFEYTAERVIHLLRTKTAVGHTWNLYRPDGRPDVDIEVTLTYLSREREEAEHDVPFSYASPEDYLEQRQILALSDYKELLSRKEESKAKGKMLVMRSKEVSAGGREIECYVFIASRPAFRKIAENNGLGEGEAWDIRPGIYIATRSMPTGVTVPFPETTAAGYWFNLYIVLQDDELSFDLGRKSLRGAAVAMFADIAEQLFNEVRKYIPGRFAETLAADLEKRETIQRLWQEARATADLGVPGLSYRKVPTHEQALVALFYELVGAGHLKGYGTMRNGGKDQYDAFVRYSVPSKDLGANQAADVKGDRVDNEILIEFKPDAADIIRDLKLGSKKYEDIDLLVVWSLDEKALAKEEIAVEQIIPADVYFLGSTHRLLFPSFLQFGGTGQIHCICLQTVVENIRTGR